MLTCVYNGSRDVLGGDYRFAVFNVRGLGVWVLLRWDGSFETWNSVLV